MARTSRSATLDSKTKRLGLEKAKFYTETLANGCYLVYRRPQSDAAGTFYVRWKSPETKKFQYSKIGAADDVVKADGVAVFTYQQAKDWAKDWFKRCSRKDQAEAAGEVVPKGEWTVQDVIDFYIADARKTRKNPKTAEDALQAANANILPELGAIAIPRLTSGRVEKWHADLAGRGRRKTGWKRQPGELVEYLPLDPSDKLAVKRRKSSANRELALLKAALNLAVEKGKIDREHLPWISVKPYKGVKGQRVRFLNLKEQVSLVKACTPAFQQLVCGALYTGARYGELTNAKVGDLDLETGALWVDGKGRDSMPRWIFLTAEGEDFFREMAADRPTDELLFIRHDVERGTRKDLVNANGWLKDDAKTPLRLALKAAKIERMTFHELRHTYASMLVNSGFSLKVVADQLGHKDTRMVEEHYGHLCDTAKREMIRSKSPVQGLTGERRDQIKMAKNIQPIWKTANSKDIR